MQISIDGIVASKDGKVIETGADGTFTVDVPIGSHFITVSKQGHTFADGGRFPANALEKHNFQTSLNGMLFTDQTTIRIKGRVAGGKPQTDKQLGFGLSKANIGQATVTLETVSDDYSLNLTEEDSTVTNNIGGKYSTTTFKKGRVIKIETNPKTGEFLAVLPPVPYQITGIKTKDFEDTFVDDDVRDFECSKTIFNPNPFIADTAKYTDPVTGTTTVFVSNDSVKITKYNNPEFLVTDKNNKNGAFGDSIYVYINPTTGAKNTIRLYTVETDGTVTYALGVPVLSQETQKYTWNVKAYEEYINKDDDEWVSDIVKLEGSQIAISNALAAERIIVDSITYKEVPGSREESSSLMVLDTAGSRDYTFAVSFPNMAGDHQLNAKLTLNSNGKDYVWEKSAILFGQMLSDGNNFVTKGPDHVDIVLHDPPGSNSYAYIEKGSSYTYTTNHTDVATMTEALNLTLHLGGEVVTGAGVGLMVMNEVKSIVDVETNTEFEEVWTNNNEKETTLTFGQQISTSGDPNYIGSMADVYIGRSTNLIFGMMNQLALYPKADIPDGVTPSNSTGAFSLFSQRVLTAEQQFGTAFTYTQTHILETQIPNIKELRNQLITPVTNKNDTVNIFFGKEEKIKYVSFLPANDPQFGDSLTYYVFYAPKATTERDAGKDEVREYNTWILNWEARIRENEETQIKLFGERAKYEENKAANASDIWNKKYIFENVSYDAGVALEKSLEISYSDLTISGFNWTAGSSIGGTTGFGANKWGLEINGVVGAKREQGDETTSGSGNLMKFGYVLAEDESVLFAGQDALSVDVYGPMCEDMKKGFELDKIYSLSGYTFQRRAGQTSCPHEEADSTLFYKKEGKAFLKNYGTFKIEKAQLYVDNKTSASVENIPAGREGTFKLQLQNLSEAKMDVTYRLAVDAATNPNGLILELDGMPLTDVRQIRVKYGEEITKVLKVRQSSTDILDYENIAIRFGSVCDIFDYSEAYISAKFIPSSSPVKLVSNSRLANINGLNNGGKIRFTISDYDRSYRNFGCIRLEYRSVTNENWTTLHTYVNDKTLYPVDSEDRELITGPSHAFDFTYNETVPSDGEYIFRAVAVSKIGTNEITSESEEIRVTKDTRAPQVLGYPSPVNGVLKAGDNVSLTFNEDIQSGKLVGGLVGSNFRITGIPNGDIREEPTVGIAFTGTERANVEMPVYTNGSFSIETWFKRTKNTEGTLFAYGSGNEYISLGFDATGHAVIAIGNETYSSTHAINNTDDTWKYIGLSYDRNANTVSVFEFEGATQNQLFLSIKFTATPAIQGKLYVGNNASGNKGFRGAVGLLHFYGTARSEAEMSGAKSLTKSGTEPNLIGLWEMEECEGTLAKDKARARHLSLNNASWYIYPQGKTVALNGTSQSVKIPSHTFPFRTYDDFTWEFWFSGNTQGAATLFSCGSAASVGFNAEHQLTLTAGANTQVLATAGLLDNKWHHFALSVKRNGMTKALIDGTVTATFNSNIFNGSVGGGYYYLGARYYGAEATPQFGSYFAGNVDELRVWNLAHTTESLVLNKNSKLRGNEAGLLAYYPFEQNVHVNGSVWNVTTTLNDMVTGSTNIAVSTGAFSNNSTPVKNSRPVKDIPFTFTASERTIVLNITEEAYRIEGVTLYISTKNVLDMHDNTSQPVSWIAYVNRNPLNWNTDKVDIVMEKGEQRTFTASISNTSGEAVDYFIESLPAWLSTGTQQGILEPLTSKKLTFTINNGINTGSYETSLTLIGINNVRKTLPVNVKVTGERPDWSVNPSDYESSMTATGQILIEGFPQEDEEDLLAAFIGDTCVGLASPQYEAGFNACFVYMTIWGNPQNVNQEVTFKVWDASTGNLYPVVELSQNGQPLTVKFVDGDIQGTPDKPILFNALDMIEQNITLDAGWNWLSFNIANGSVALLDQFKTNTAGFTTQIKNDDGKYINHAGSIWGGTLESVSVREGYLAKTTRAATLKMVGKAVKPAEEPVSLAAGKWNWIGYTPQFTLNVADALAGIAAPQQGDQIKGQQGYRIWSTNGWVGSLSAMKPGRGYMYKSNNISAVTFNYPSVSTTLKAVGIPQAAPLAFNPRWKTDYHRYTNTMTVTTAVLLDGMELQSGEIEIAAFSNGECRGNAALQYVNGFDRPDMGFLMVYGNQGDPIEFRIYDHSADREYVASERFTFLTDSIFGTPDKLFALNITEGFGSEVSIYPNPVANDLFIRRGDNMIDRLEITDMSGSTLLLRTDFSEASVNVSRFTQVAGQTSVHKFMKK